MEKINIVLPGSSRKPIGGYKVIYEYANKLAEDGYNINIILPATLFWSEQNLKEKIKGILRYFCFKIIKKKYLPYKWFNLNKKIQIYLVLTLEEKNIPDADYIFATACQTAEYIEKYSRNKGKKLYLIQSYEDWSMKEERLLKTWKAPMKKIVISKYLKQKALDLGLDAHYIENGLSFNDFYQDELIKKEDETLMMLYHKDENVKQSRKCLKKLLKLKEKYPELKIILFGVNKREVDIPEWIEYYQLPGKEILRNLYNQATIFISPSKIEGWALPPAEAMQCGTCVCVTDIDGHEYVSHLKTGYRTSVDLNDLEESIIFLFENKDVRKKLEIEGKCYIQNFTWDRAYFKLKKVLNNY